MRPSAQLRWATVCLLPIALAWSCRSAGPQSPQQLRAAYVEALASDDADAAYALLAPEARAEISEEQFRRRWKGQAAERAAMVREARAMEKRRTEGLREATSAHPGGRTLRWVEVDGKYQIIEGLPGLPQTTTPAQTIRAFLRAVRRTDWSVLRALVSEELAGRMREDWAARAAAIERALQQPGRLKLSEDAHRAELRYEAGRALLLEQTAQGWRITAIE